LRLHAAHVRTVQSNQGAIDVLLVGDSITIQWSGHWKHHFPNLKTVNIGIGGDKTQNVLWRLDHGGVDGISPRHIVLMIGNNNMFYTPETGVGAAASGIRMCALNLREKFPNARLTVLKILPAHAPGNRFREHIQQTNAALDSLSLAEDPRIRVVDLTLDFTSSDGALLPELYAADAIHLSPAGYAVLAGRLGPLLELP
jgi:lysophospholipase L1-like esterase